MIVKPRSIEELKRAVAAGTVRCNQMNEDDKRCRKVAVAICVCGDVACEEHRAALYEQDGGDHGEPVR